MVLLVRQVITYYLSRVSFTNNARIYNLEHHDLAADFPSSWDSIRIELTPLLVVDGSTITSDADKLAKVTVKAEVVKPAKGPKITIMKYKNKTGYKKRQGHRQHLTQVKITAINA